MAPFNSTIPNDSNYTYVVNYKAPVYIIEGVGGNDQDWAKFSDKWNLTLTAHYDCEKPGLGLFTAINETHAYYQHVHSKKGGVEDTFYLIKNYTGPLYPPDTNLAGKLKFK
jgi:hypothetical protein